MLSGFWSLRFSIVFRVWGLGFRIWDLGCRVWDLGFEFRVWGSGFIGVLSLGLGL